MYKRILVPTDGSALSGKAIRSAIDLASTTPRCWR
jgi:nucleotide-binding universal stress UspA family protein